MLYFFSKLTEKIPWGLSEDTIVLFIYVRQREIRCEKCCVCCVLKRVFCYFLLMNDLHPNLVVSLVTKEGDINHSAITLGELTKN